MVVVESVQKGVPVLSAHFFIEQLCLIVKASNVAQVLDMEFADDTRYVVIVAFSTGSKDFVMAEDNVFL